ncbi:MAG: IPT/TIG domain-containing protein [Deltaproteobacteria bacterium]|nr:IPT/TIG domain-containing protein [Deltaproteobacteria bacterium]
MRLRIILSVLACSFLFAACERSFDSPPPVPVVEGFSPAHAFADDLIDIQVSNPGVAGELAVYFGTAKAEILSSGENGVTVKVPVLETGASVPIQVSTSGGQADSGENLFVYDGHGHPLQQILIEERTSRVSPTVVFTAPRLSLGMLAFLNADSRHIGVMMEDSGLHTEIGMCGTPMSAALGVAPDADAGAQFWIVALQETLEMSDSNPTQLMRLHLNIDSVISPIQVEPLPQLDGEAFVPFMVKSLCANALCNQNLMAITDLNTPSLAVAAVPSMNESINYTLQSIDEADLLCPVDHSRILDMVQDPASDDVFALPTNSPEVWRIPLGLGTPERVFPGDDAPLVCARSFSALAMDPRREGVLDPRTLYVTQFSPIPKLHMLRETILGWQQLDEVVLDGLPFAVTGGRFDDEAGITHARIYVMTSNGLRGFDVSNDELEPVVSLPQAVIIGGPQSLTTDSKYRPLLGRPADTIVFADTASDRLITWTVGQEAELIHHLPVGPIIPSMARSMSQPLDFLADAFSNSIRVLDRDSAAQVGLFGIDGNLTFGTSYLTTLSLDNMELLLIPKMNAGGGPGRFKGLVVHRVDEAVDLPGCRASLQDGQEDFANTLRLFEDVSFDRMLYVDSPTPCLVFMLDYDEASDTEGPIWIREVNKASPGFDAEIFGATFVLPRATIPRDLKTFALDQTASLLGAVAPDGTSSDENAYALVMHDLLNDLYMTMPMSSLLARQAGALAVMRSDSEGRTIYSAFLSINGTGEIWQLRFDSSGALENESILNVGGMPTSLSLSPDSRRLYAPHSLHNMLSIIDIDCDSNEGDCPNLQANLNVGAYPSQVIFRPDGGQALLLHHYNSIQTVIE